VAKTIYACGYVGNPFEMGQRLQQQQQEQQQEQQLQLQHQLLKRFE